MSYLTARYSKVWHCFCEQCTQAMMLRKNKFFELKREKHQLCTVALLFYRIFTLANVSIFTRKQQRWIPFFVKMQTYADKYLAVLRLLPPVITQMSRSCCRIGKNIGKCRIMAVAAFY